MYQEYDDNSPVVDWSQVVMPHLQHLDLNYCLLDSIEFNTTNTPNLRLLGLEHPGQGVWRSRTLKVSPFGSLRSVNNPSALLPAQWTISQCCFVLAVLGCTESAAADGRNFGKSVSACPNLEQISGYKLWGLGDAEQKFNLFDCKTCALDRPDGLYHLEMVAPKLTELELLDCHDLEHVRLLPREGSPVKVSLMGTTLDKGSLQHLRKHPRIGSSRISYEDPMIDEYIEHMMDDPFLPKDEIELQKLKEHWRSNFI